MGELLKRTEEFRVGTETEAQELIQQTKDKANEEWYELKSYSSIHKVAKNDDWYLVKLIKVW